VKEEKNGRIGNRKEKLKEVKQKEKIKKKRKGKLEAAKRDPKK